MNRKFLFKSAKFDSKVSVNKINGIGDLAFDYFRSTDSDILFSESLYTMTSDLYNCESLYYGKINGLDIFSIFYKRSINDGEVREAVKEIVEDGRLENIVNAEDVFIDLTVRKSKKDNSSFYETEDNTIFWDSINHMIIIIGRENCLKLAYVLEAERYRDYIEKFKLPISSLVRNDTIHEFTKKLVIEDKRR